jgi:hypothetical protein
MRTTGKGLEDDEFSKSGKLFRISFLGISTIFCHPNLWWAIPVCTKANGKVLEHFVRNK